MRRKPGGPWNALFIALLATATPAFAADIAPVPQGFEAEPGATVNGVFARAISYGSYRGYSAVPDSVVAAEEACIARGRSLEYHGDTRRRNETTFWLYRNGTETVIFLSEAERRVDADCRVTFEERRKILRSKNKAGVWPIPFETRRLHCSGSVRKCSSTMKFGIKARCRVDGDGFWGSSECVSIERGPSRGMMLESVFETDELQGNAFEVRELMTQASIDASIFDHSRTW